MRGMGCYEHCSPFAECIGHWGRVVFTAATEAMRVNRPALR